ncbi:ankyrin repeat domain-containing protein [Microbulbifer sp. 2201CG32-9]|uniref:ankyrin repeat domain-containing protein n=1 Tax=Microbulbifer sp. 2201CG32-9 TaxID=3232309 RepID=UPI00345C4362
MRSLLVTLLLLALSSHAAEGESEPRFEDLLPYYFAAARSDNTEVLREFVQAGFPLDARNPKGYTALMIATYHGNSEAANYLLAQGADACAEDNRGNTALMAAIFRGEFALARTLIQRDCDLQHRNKAGNSAAGFAQVFGRDKIARLLGPVDTN